MVNVKIHELAVKEFEEASDWYEEQLNGLGNRFKTAVFYQIKQIRLNPSWFLKESETIYKAFIPKFPFKILYTIEDDHITIWAMAHLSRKPWYWQSRIT